MRELERATTTVLSSMAGGDSVEVRRQNEPVAILSPPKRRTGGAADFAARLRSIYADHVLATTGTDLMAESRARHDRYADTGLLCSLYAPDAHTGRVVARMQRQALPLPLTWLRQLEFRNALRLRVFRGEITPPQRDASLNA